jgi:hypothetical protein
MRAVKKWIIVMLLTATAAGAQQTHRQYEPSNAPGAGQKLLAKLRVTGTSSTRSFRRMVSRS